MHAIKAKIPVLCGYSVMAAAIALMSYTAACAPRPEEQWNSYYYGTAPQYEHGIMYYGGKDVDDNYSLPDDMDRPDDDRNIRANGLLHGQNLQEDTLLHGNRIR